jgi:hypothetical protein
MSRMESGCRDLRLHGKLLCQVVDLGDFGPAPLLVTWCGVSMTCLCVPTCDAMQAGIRHIVAARQGRANQTT